MFQSRSFKAKTSKSKQNNSQQCKAGSLRPRFTSWDGENENTPGTVPVYQENLVQIGRTFFGISLA